MDKTKWVDGWLPLDTYNRNVDEVVTTETETIYQGTDFVEEAVETYPKHTGGGYYELSNGEKVKGKDAAIEAEKAL